MEYDKAAKLIFEADIILIAAGAGFSADSGLPVYADIAKDQKYVALDKTYADLADIGLLVSDSELFLEFWKNCVIQYNKKTPHVGYHILNQWCERLLTRKLSVNSSLSPYYVYTSNVDGYFRQLSALRDQLCEMHGCVEEYVCSSSIGYVYDNNSEDEKEDIDTKPRISDFWESWNCRTTPDQRIRCSEVIVSSETSFLNPTGPDNDNLVLCSSCQLPLRPKVVMFNDTCPNVLSRVMQDTDRYQNWEGCMEQHFEKSMVENLVILELGCGTRVPSVKIEMEEVLRDVASIQLSKQRKSPSLIRINLSKDDADISHDIMAFAPDSISIHGSCKSALTIINEKVMAMCDNVPTQNN